MGAEVIKVENPFVGGDSTRACGPFVNERSTYYATVNRNKKCVTLNLKDPKGKEMLLGLVRQVDVVTENFKPGTLEKLGLGFDVMRSVNEKIILASISGYGQTGPYSSRPGYDVVSQSMGGIMSLYAGVHYNRWFSKAACVSSAIGFCMRPLMKDVRTGPISPDTRIYLSWGTREAWGIKNPEEDDRHSKTYNWNKKVADHIHSTGASVKMHCQIGGGHCEADWEQLVPTFMNFLWME